MTGDDPQIRITASRRLSFFPSSALQELSPNYSLPSQSYRDTASASLATNSPGVAQPADASTKNALLNGAAAAKANDSAAGKPSATDANYDAVVTHRKTAPKWRSGGQFLCSAPAAPTNSAKGSGNGKTQGATPPNQKSQDTPTPSNTPNSNSNANAPTPPAETSASETSAPPGTTPSDSITPSGTPPGAADSATTAPPTNPTYDGSSISGAGAPTQTNARLSPPNSSSAPSTNSGTSFLQNKGLVIGLAVAGGLLIALFLIYVIMRCMRGRRRRQLDREMDASFEETVNRWRPPPTVPDHDDQGGAGLQRAPSAMSTASASYAAYTAPPMAVAPQQPNYGLGYAPAQQEYWTAGAPPQMSMAMGGAPAMGMGAAPGMMVQQSAAVQYAHEPQVQQTRNDYLSNYAPQDSAGGESPVSPTPMPNPFDSRDERVLKVANE
ncbi:hypothetical protein B0H19DRAFT_1065883 [Mycena capillaripes]|nr:hypothetical protein B0H19DRAFT_1065883 [Mycena capillaripes]